MKLTRNQVFWWSPPGIVNRILNAENVGDHLGPHIVDRILECSGLSLKPQRNRLLTIGSVLHFSKSGDVIWGTGINGKISLDGRQFQGLDIRALRGPLTAEVLKSKGVPTPTVYGDPGILVSRLWPLQRVQKTRKVLYIPHMREKSLTADTTGMDSLSPLTPFLEFIAEVKASEKVVTTSLHGLIIAESYGIPAVLIKNSSGETDFKYNDYYLGTERTPPVGASSVSEALAINDAPPDLRDAQERLLAAFPYDLWQQIKSEKPLRHAK